MANQLGLAEHVFTENADAVAHQVIALWPSNSQTMSW